MELLFTVHSRRLAHALRVQFPAELRRQMDWEDLAQDTLLKLLKRLDSMEIERPGQLTAWLLASAKNRVIDLFRRKGAGSDPHGPRSPKAEGDGLPTDYIAQVRGPGADSPSAVLARRDAEVSAQKEREAFDEAMYQLAEHERDLVLRFHIFGESYASLGDDLGCSPEAVRKRIQRLRRRLERLAGAPDER